MELRLDTICLEQTKKIQMLENSFITNIKEVLDMKSKLEPSLKPQTKGEDDEDKIALKKLLEKVNEDISKLK